MKIEGWAECPFREEGFCDCPENSADGSCPTIERPLFDKQEIVKRRKRAEDRQNGSETFKLINRALEYHVLLLEAAFVRGPQPTKEELTKRIEQAHEFNLTHALIEILPKDCPLRKEPMIVELKGKK